MNLYNVRVNNYSLPSFVSGDINYYGTEQEIIRLLINGEKNRVDIIAAAEEYFSGKGPGEVSVFGEEPMPIIRPVKLIGEAAYHKGNLNYKFINIWDCETDINIEHLEAHLIYIKDSNSKYRRCVKATIKNATYKSKIIGKPEQVGESQSEYWGYPGFIELEKPESPEGPYILKNTLYFADTIFKTKEQARKDMNHPHKPYLRQFFLGIYGDG